MISTSKLCAEHLFAGRNTQQIAFIFLHHKSAYETITLLTEA